MTWFSGFAAIVTNAEQALTRMAGKVGFCFMTTTRACRGTGVSGWGRATVWDWVWPRLGIMVENGLPLTRTPTLVGIGLGLP